MCVLFYVLATLSGSRLGLAALCGLTRTGIPGYPRPAAYGKGRAGHSKSVRRAVQQHGRVRVCVPPKRQFLHSDADGTASEPKFACARSGEAVLCTCAWTRPDPPLGPSLEAA